MIEWGKYKFWMERLTWYPAKGSFIVTLLIAVKVYDVSLWWFLLLPPILVALYFFDKKKVIPGEFSQAVLLNPEWQRLFKQIKELHEDRKP